jgi:hypothetical protein
MSFTAAGLFGTFTRFPFNPSGRINLPEPIGGKDSLFFLNFNTVLLFKKWFLYTPFVQEFREISKKRNRKKRKFGQEDAESLSDSC